MTAKAVAGLLPPGISATGSARLDGRELLTLDERGRRRIAGPGIGFVFQDAMSALHPLMTIREQMIRPIRLHLGLGRRQAAARALDLLDRVGIREPADVLNGYIHQLSGGMRQRVMIAMAISCDPGVLIADEPTTALDAAVQERILELVADLRTSQDIAVLLISHDLAVVSRHSDRIAVMYGGRLLESGRTHDVLRNPQHPYTRGLLDASPERNRGARRLPVFSGRVLGLDDLTEEER
jgi:ABC-type dipeptide/oligopeptide/nickel transport system ATPase component